MIKPIIAIVVLIAVMILFFAVRNLGVSQGTLNEITKTAKENENAFENAENFDANFAKCRSRGLRFDFATGKCNGP